MISPGAFKCKWFNQLFKIKKKMKIKKNKKKLFKMLVTNLNKLRN